MFLAAVDPKLQECADALGDPRRTLSEFELHAMRRYLELESQRVTDIGLLGMIFAMKASCYLLLRQDVKAEEAGRLALQRLREPTASRANALNNQAMALGRLGRYNETVPLLVEAAKIPSPHTSSYLANLAESLHRVGNTASALEVFEHALEAIADPGYLLGMARQAAAIGLRAEAVELTARYLASSSEHGHSDRSALEIIMAATDEQRLQIGSAPRLVSAIVQHAAMLEELNRPPAATSADAAADAEASDVFEATRHLREAAIAGAFSA